MRISECLEKLCDEIQENCEARFTSSDIEKAMALLDKFYDINNDIVFHVFILSHMLSHMLKVIEADMDKEVSEEIH